MTSEHEWEFRDYLAPLTIYPIHYAIHEYGRKDMVNKTNKYNKYISKSLINVHSQKISRYSENEYEGIIYYLIYIAYHQKKRTGNSKLTELFQSMKKKDLQRFCKTFEHFYGYKLTPYNLTS